MLLTKRGRCFRVWVVGEVWQWEGEARHPHEAEARAEPSQRPNPCQKTKPRTNSWLMRWRLQCERSRWPRPSSLQILWVSVLHSFEVPFSLGWCWRNLLRGQSKSFVKLEWNVYLQTYLYFLQISGCVPYHFWYISFKKLILWGFVMKMSHKVWQEF